MTRAAGGSESLLVRALGVGALAASIVNITVGGGIFRLPANVAASLGAAAPLAYLACAAVMGLIVLCFAEAGSRVALTGGPYAYVEVALGSFVGFIAGVLLWLTGTFATAAIAVAFVESGARLVPALEGGAAMSFFLVAVLAGLAATNITGVRRGARLNTVVTVLKLLPLLLLAVAGLFAIRPENLRIESMPGPGEVSRTSLLLIFAFCGIETALTPSGEVKDPARTVPRAIALAMTGITLLYLVTQVVAQGVLGPDLGRETVAPLAEAAGRVLGPWGRSLMLVGATVSMFGYLSGMTLAVPRALYAFARDGFLPAALAAVHPRYRTPHVAIALQAGLGVALALSSTFERLAILANLSTLVLYALCCLAAFELRRRDVRAGGPPFRVPVPGVVPLLAGLAIAWMLTAIRAEEWAAFGVCMLSVSLLFALRPGRPAAGALAPS